MGCSGQITLTTAVLNAGTNTYLLGRGPSRILLDTGEGLPSWPPLLEKVLQDENAKVSICLLSHWHHDHIGGVEQLLDICGRQGHDDVKVHKCTPDLDPDGILAKATSRRGLKVENVRDGDRFAVLHGQESEQEFEVRAFYCPGHTQDHMAFVVTKSSDENEVGCMFTADNVLGHGTAVFEDLGTYMTSLGSMKNEVGAGKRAFPGHGEVIRDGKEKIQEYIDHRKMREDEAMNVLRFGTAKAPQEIEGGKELVPGKEWGSMEMVKVIYADVPESLHQPAERGLLMVLEKLKGEGRVVETRDGKWRVSEKSMM